MPQIFILRFSETYIRHKGPRMLHQSQHKGEASSRFRVFRTPCIGFLEIILKIQQV